MLKSKLHYYRFPNGICTWAQRTSLNTEGILMILSHNGRRSRSVGGKHPKPQGSPVNYNAQLELTGRGDASSRLMASPDMRPFTGAINGQFIRTAL